MTSDKNLSVEFIGWKNKAIGDNSFRNYLSQKKQTSRSSVIHKSEKLIAYKKSTNKIPNVLLIGSCINIPKYMQIMKKRDPNEFNRKYHKLIQTGS